MGNLKSKLISCLTIFILLITNTSATVIDINTLQTQTGSEHTCVWVKKYNDTAHWEECVLNSNEIRNYCKHNLSTRYTISETSCHPSNQKIIECSGCDYTVISDTNIPHGDNLVWGWSAIDYRVFQKCKDCNTAWINSKPMTSSGVEITLDSERPVVVDYINYTLADRYVPHVVPLVMNCEYLDGTNIRLTGTFDISGLDDKFKNYTKTADVSRSFFHFNDNCGNDKALTCQTLDIVGNSLVFSGIYDYSTFRDITKQWRNDILIGCYLAAGKLEEPYNEYVFRGNPTGSGSRVRVRTQPDISIDSCSITKDKMVSDYCTKATLSVTATKIYTHGATIELYDGNTKLISKQVAVDNCAINTQLELNDMEISQEKDVTMKITDDFGNSATKTITIPKIDSKAPTLTATIDNINFASSKILKITATDNGIGSVQFAINKNSGYETTSQVGNQFTKDYTVVGTLKGSLKINIYAKDGLGNMKTYLVDIANLDSTEPVIKSITLLSTE